MAFITFTYNNNLKHFGMQSNLWIQSLQSHILHCSKSVGGKERIGHFPKTPNIETA